MKKAVSVVVLLSLLLSSLIFSAWADPLDVDPPAENLDDHLITHWDFVGDGDEALADKATRGATKDNLRAVGDANTTTISGSGYVNSNTQANYFYAENSADLFKTNEDRTVYIRFRCDKTDGWSKTDRTTLISQQGAIYLGAAQNTSDEKIQTVKLDGTANGTRSSSNDWVNTANMNYTGTTWATVAVSYDKNLDGSYTVTTFYKVEGDANWTTASVTWKDGNAKTNWTAAGANAVLANYGSLDADVLLLGRAYNEFTWSSKTYFDDVRIYDKALTAGEVDSIQVSNVRNIEKNLITHWDFVGSTAEEALSDKAVYGESSDTLIAVGTTNLTNEAFSGYVSNGAAGNFYYASNSADLFKTTEDRTVYIRVKMVKTDGWSKTDRSSLISQQGAIYIGASQDSSDSKIQVVKMNGTTNGTRKSSNDWIQTNNMNYTGGNWLTFAVTYDKNADGSYKTTSYFKEDGGSWVTGSVTWNSTNVKTNWADAGTNAIYSQYGVSDKDALFLGRAYDEFTWPSMFYFDDVRIYNVALTEDEVKSITATNGDAVEMKGHNVSLSDEIALNFYLKPNSPLYLNNNQVTVSVTCGAAELVNALFDAEHQTNVVSGAYRFSAELAAKQMADTLVLTVKYGSTVLYTENYSVKQYADYILQHADRYSDETVSLVKAMLNYGGYVQEYFGYQTGALANAGLSETLPELPASGYATVVEGSVSGVSVEATLQLDAKIRVVFRVTKADAGQVLNCTGGEAVENGNVITVTSAGILPTEYATQQVLTVSGSGNTVTVRYSPMTYLVNQKDNANVSDLVRALYAYHLAAVAYVGE